MVFGLVACNNKEIPNPTVSSKPTTTQPSVSMTEPSKEVTSEPTEDTSDPTISEEPEFALTNSQKLLAVLMEMNPVDFEIMNEIVDITDSDSVKYYTGLDNSESVVSVAFVEPMMRASAFSIVLVEVNNENETSTIERAMIAGVDPNKWICVSADDVETITAGRFVLLAMMSSNIKGINSRMVCDNFVEMMKDEHGAILKYDAEHADVIKIDTPEPIDEPTIFDVEIPTESLELEPMPSENNSNNDEFPNAETITPDNEEYESTIEPTTETPTEDIPEPPVEDITEPPTDATLEFA